MKSAQADTLEIASGSQPGLDAGAVGTGLDGRAIGIAHPQATQQLRTQISARPTVALNNMTLSITAGVQKEGQQQQQVKAVSILGGVSKIVLPQRPAQHPPEQQHFQPVMHVVCPETTALREHRDGIRVKLAKRHLYFDQGRK